MFFCCTLINWVDLFIDAVLKCHFRFTCSTVIGTMCNNYCAVMIIVPVATIRTVIGTMYNYYFLNVLVNYRIKLNVFLMLTAS